MAFMKRIGNLLKQPVSSNPSIYQTMRFMSSSKLFIGGLSYNTDDQSLSEAFSSYGQVIEARVIVDRETGRSRGFGFVTFTSSDEASAAISGMDGKDLHGRWLKVAYATDRRSGGYVGGGGGGGWAGGYGGGEASEGYGGDSYSTGGAIRGGRGGGYGSGSNVAGGDSWSGSFASTGSAGCSGGETGGYGSSAADQHSGYKGSASFNYDNQNFSGQQDDLLERNPGEEAGEADDYVQRRS